MATLVARPQQLGAGWAFGAIWSKSLRAYRVAILAWGIGLGLLLMATAAASPSVSTAAGQLSSVTQSSFSFFGNPVAIGTPEGYITFKFLGLLPLMLGIWTVIAGAHLTRGDEESGALDLLLGEPVSRARLMGEKIIAFALGIILVGALITVFLMLGLASAKLSPDVSGSLLAGVNIILTMFVYGALGIFFSQFTRTAGAAAGIAGAYMAVDFLVAGAMRSSNGPEWISRLTINYYSELSKPIIAGYGANPGALLVLLAIGIVLVAASMWLFVRRDAGDVVKLWSRVSQSALRRAQVAPAVTLTRAQGDLSLRGVTARALAANWLSIFWWMVGITVFGVYGVFIAQAAEKVIAQAFQSSAVLKTLFSGANLGTNNGFIAGIEFAFIPFVTVLAAMFFAINWAQDLDRGRLETVLGEPLPRWRLPLERFVTVVVGVVGLALVAWLAPLLGAALSGFKLDGGDLASAGLGLIPLGLLVGALVYALAGRLSSGVILGVVGGLATLSFLVELIQSLLKFPDWVFNLSIFHVYGQPMLNGVNWTGSLVMLALAAALLAVALYRFTRADMRQ
jgi:ABC-2 type transport system permease protein